MRQVRGGSRIVLYQCTFCGAIDENSESHLHQGKTEVAPHHKPKKVLHVRVERTRKDKIR